MPYLDFGAADLHAADRGTLSPVHLRPTRRFPFLWLYRGRPPRSWWRSCLAAVSLDPLDLETSRRHLCPACLPLARAVPAPLPPAGQSTSPDAPQINGQPARAPAPPVSEATHGRTDESIKHHILALRQVFNREAIVTGVIGKGHRGIELTRGVATVRCRACGQEVARVAALAGGPPWDDPPYEYTPAGLCVCPDAQSAVS